MKRKFLEFLLMFLAFALRAAAQVPYIPINTATNGSGTPTNASCGQMAVVSGDIIVASVNWESVTATPSFSDTLTSTWTQRFIDTSDTVKVAVYTAPAASTGNDTVSVSVASGNWMTIQCSQYPVSLFSATVDVSNSNSFASTPATTTSPSLTTTLNHDLIYSHVGCRNNSNLFTTSTGWYEIGTNTQASNDSGVASFKVGGLKAAGEQVVYSNSACSFGTNVIVAFKSQAIQITSPSALPDAGLSVAYSYTLQAAGGAGSLTWSITGGSLQPGLSLNTSTGAITGTPTSGPQNTITFQVTDGTNTTTKSVTLKVSTTLNTISVPHSCTGASSGCTLTSVTSGNLVVLIVWNSVFDLGWSTCSDTFGSVFQTYVIGETHRTANGAAGFHFMQICAAVAASSGNDVLSRGATGVANLGYAAYEIANAKFLASDNTLTTAGVTTTPSTITSGTLTTLVVNEIIVAGATSYSGTGTMTIQSPFTDIGPNSSGRDAGYDIVTTATGYTVTFTESSDTTGIWLMALMAIRPSGGAAAPAGGPRHRGKVI